MKNYLQLFVLSLIVVLPGLFSTCQKQAIDKKAKQQIAQDSLKIDSTKIDANELSYPSEPEGYKGIHQQEKERQDQNK